MNTKLKGAWAAMLLALLAFGSSAEDPRGVHSFCVPPPCAADPITQVPEPGTGPLIVIGGVGILIALRMKFGSLC